MKHTQIYKKVIWHHDFNWAGTHPRDFRFNRLNHGIKTCLKIVCRLKGVAARVRRNFMLCIFWLTKRISNSSNTHIFNKNSFKLSLHDKGSALICFCLTLEKLKPQHLWHFPMKRDSYPSKCRCIFCQSKHQSSNLPWSAATPLQHHGLWYGCRWI